MNIKNAFMQSNKLAEFVEKIKSVFMEAGKQFRSLKVAMGGEEQIFRDVGIIDTEELLVVLVGLLKTFVFDPNLPRQEFCEVPTYAVCTPLTLLVGETLVAETTIKLYLNYNAAGDACDFDFQATCCVPADGSLFASFQRGLDSDEIAVVDLSQTSQQPGAELFCFGNKRKFGKFIYKVPDVLTGVSAVVEAAANAYVKGADTGQCR